MNGKLKKNIGFSLMPFAFLFLFEPGYTVLDPLPDFIGYLILCISLVNLADISPRIEEAYKGVRKAAFVSLLRFIAIYLLVTFFHESEKSIGLLLFAFIFSFAELVVLLPTYKQFYEGLLSLSVMHDGTAPHYQKKRIITRMNRKSGERIVVEKVSRRNATEKRYTLTCVFLILHSLAMTLPEFTSLATNQNYEFVELLRAFGVMIVLPVGLWWLISMIVYFRRIASDKPFVENLSRLYVDRLKDNPQFYTVRVLLTGLGMLMIGFLLTTDFYADYVNVLPDFFAYAVLIAAAVCLRGFSHRWKYLLTASVFSFMVSVAAHISSVAFHTEYYPNAIRKNIDAYNAFYGMVSINAVEAVFLAITALMTLLLLWDIYKSCIEFAGNHLLEPYKTVKRSFTVKSGLVLVGAIIAAAGLVYFVMSQPFYNTGKWWFYYSTMISVFLSLVFAVGAACFINYVVSFVKLCYRRYI